NSGALGPYGLTCRWCIVACAGRPDFSVLKHVLVPGLGLLMNVAMLGAILYLYVIGNADSQHEAYICLGIAGAWALVSALYVVFSGMRSGRKLIPATRSLA